MSKPRQLLVTAALPYANGELHLGHLVGTIQADIWARVMRACQHQVHYICGDDAHGTPIMLHAEKLGITAEELIKQIKVSHEADFRDFAVEFDYYHTTHSTENQQLAEAMYQQLQAASAIEEKTIQQAYDPEREMFLPDRYVTGSCPNCKACDQYGDSCEVCGATYASTELIDPKSVLTGAKPVEKTSTHYFFKLGQFQDFLRHWTNSGTLQEEVHNKLKEWLDGELRHWDITRDAPYFGFKIPGTNDKYFYVWLDAPIGYMASLQAYCQEHNCPELFAAYWEHDAKTELIHFIGKDIIYFHTLFWPAVLHAAGYRTPSAVWANGFLTINGLKMSKSRGTFIRARTYLEHLDAEALRYYLAAKLNDGIDDIDLNLDDFRERVNADVVGKFVNIASRCSGFLSKHFANTTASTLTDASLINDIRFAGEEICNLYQSRQYSHAIRKIMTLADHVNQYIDAQKPWQLIKDESRKEEVQQVCTVGINAFRLLSHYLAPVLPKLATKISAYLNAPIDTFIPEQDLLGHTLNNFVPLMQRIDAKDIANMLEASKASLAGEVT